MTQAYSLPTGSDRLNVAIKTKIAGSLEALRTLHEGGTEPANKVANMLWLDTSSTPSVLKLRDVGDTTWQELMSISGDQHLRMEASGHAGTLSATTTDYVGTVPKAGTVKRIVLLAHTVSVSTPGNEWQVQLKKYPNAAPGSPVDMISAACGTDTVLGGVGGGVEHAIDLALVYTPDQNAGVLDLDVLELILTKSGTATTLAQFRAFVEMV